MALSRKMTCNLRHPIGLRHSVCTLSAYIHMQRANFVCVHPYSLTVFVYTNIPIYNMNVCVYSYAARWLCVCASIFADHVCVHQYTNMQYEYLCIFICISLILCVCIHFRWPCWRTPIFQYVIWMSVCMNMQRVGFVCVYGYLLNLSMNTNIPTCHKNACVHEHAMYYGVAETHRMP